MVINVEGKNRGRHKKKCIGGIKSDMNIVGINGREIGY